MIGDLRSADRLNQALDRRLLRVQLALLQQGHHDLHHKVLGVKEAAVGFEIPQKIGVVSEITLDQRVLNNKLFNEFVLGLHVVIELEHDKRFDHLLRVFRLAILVLDLSKACQYLGKLFPDY